MEIIQHRRNTINSLKSTPYKFGVEVDIRTYNSDLIMSHDPYIKGEKFSNWISHFNHGTLIINVKEEGLEDEILFFLKKFNIKSYFFLDQSFPFLLKTSSLGNKNCAVRVSEYESIETALNLKDKISWAWVDMFCEFPISYNDFIALKSANFKLCLVSPELQSNNKLKINEVKNIILEKNIIFDAVCTKYPNNW